MQRPPRSLILKGAHDAGPEVQGIRHEEAVPADLAGFDHGLAYPAVAVLDRHAVILGRDHYDTRNSLFKSIPYRRIRFQTVARLMPKPSPTATAPNGRNIQQSLYSYLWSPIVLSGMLGHLMGSSRTEPMGAINDPSTKIAPFKIMGRPAAILLIDR